MSRTRDNENGTTTSDLPTLTNGQLIVGVTNSSPVATTLTGTTNQVNVTNSAGAVTLSLPQDISATSSPTFAGIRTSTHLYTLPDAGRDDKFAMVSNNPGVDFGGRTFGSIYATTVLASTYLYTCPVGKKCITINLALYNPPTTTGPIGYSLAIVPSGGSGTTWTVVAIGSGMISQGNRVVPLNNIMLTAGQTLMIMCVGTNGLVCTGSTVLVPTTNGLAANLLSTLTSGNLTLYTCPVGKYGMGINEAGTGSYKSPGIICCNTSGASFTATFRYVPSGGTAFTIGTITLASNADGVFSIGQTFMPGDAITVSSSSPAIGQDFYLAINET